MPGWSGEGWASTSSGVTVTAPVITHSRTISALSPTYNILTGGTSQSSNQRVFGTSLYNGGTISVHRGGVLLGTTIADASGNWSYALGIVADGTHAITATVTFSGQTSALSSTFSITIISPVTGFTNVPQQSFFLNGYQFQVQAEANSYGLQMPDSHTIRFECRQGDQAWYDTPGSVDRVDISSGYPGFLQLDQQPMKTTYEFMFEPGPSNSADDGFFLNWQLHADDAVAQVSPMIFVGLCGAGGRWTAGDRFYVSLGYWYAALGALSNGTIVWTDVYIAPSNITRGVWHTLEIELTSNNNPGAGIFKCWVDGLSVVNYTGRLGYGTAMYPGFDIYRSSVPETQTIHFRNIIQVMTVG